MSQISIPGRVPLVPAASSLPVAMATAGIAVAVVVVLGRTCNLPLQLSGKQIAKAAAGCAWCGGDRARVKVRDAEGASANQASVGDQDIKTAGTDPPWSSAGLLPRLSRGAAASCSRLTQLC